MFKTFYLKIKSLTLCGVFLVSIYGPATVWAGGVPVPVNATELTQLLNNIELGSLVSVETSNLANTAKILSTSLEQLRTEIQSYQAIMRNLEKLPEIFISSATEPIMKLQGLMAEAKNVARSAQQIDTFLRSDLIKDPLFEGKRLVEAQLTERYDKWLKQWDQSLTVGLGKVGLTLENVADEASLLDQITKRLGTEEGHLQALQASNEIASSVARQLNDLRALTATQAEQTTIAWSRVFANQDRKEAAQRKYEVQIKESLDALESNRGKARSIHEILGIGAN